MLLRHNPLLKKCYKYYSEYILDKEMDSKLEISFAMDFRRFWKFLKDMKISTSKSSLAAIQRLLLQGLKNNFELEMNLSLLKKKIEFLKSGSSQFYLRKKPFFRKEKCIRCFFFDRSRLFYHFFD